MIFKVFAKKELVKLYDLLSTNIIVGPTQKGLNREGKPLYDFDVVYEFDDLVFDYTATVHSAKRFFLPHEELLSSFTVGPDGWEKHVEINAYKPHVFFGLHACDINALNKLDKVLAGPHYPNPYYLGKRKNMFIIGMECMPQPQCFCRSMGTDTALHGFDMFLTDMGDTYFVEVLSAEAFNFLSQLNIDDPTHEDHQHFMELRAKKSSLFCAEVDATDLTKILDMEFESAAWQDWGKKCLSCGTCANVCPTCYCYGVEENVDLDLQGGNKIKRLHSCNLLDFAEVAGGHNFRPESSSRLKYRYYHKHRGFVEIFEEPLCVGCGRCGEACLADITVPEVIASVRKSVEVKNG